jgi:hypothetical protein
MTLLKNPPQGYKSLPTDPSGDLYDLPFPPAVIALLAQNFDRLPNGIQDLLLGAKWKLVRSPLMLPVVRQKAEAGNKQALRRWHDLDPVAATNFTHKEVR